MKTYQLVEEFWNCGRPGESRLLLPDSSRCCLGFVCEQEGIPDADLLFKFTPANIKGDPFGGLLPWLVRGYGPVSVSGLVKWNTAWATIAMMVNDRPTAGALRESLQTYLQDVNASETTDIPPAAAWPLQAPPVQALRGLLERIEGEDAHQITKQERVELLNHWGRHADVRFELV